MGHRHDASDLSAAAAVDVAQTMKALSAGSRVRILSELRQGARSVGELAGAVEMEPSAVSQQLRVLRHLGFVVGARRGRSVVYDLHDDHVAHLLDEAFSHVEHLRLGMAGRENASRAVGAAG